MTTLEPPAQAPENPSHSSANDVDWTVIVTAVIAFALLAFGMLTYLHPQSLGGFDNCVAERAETFVNKVDFPVIPAVTQCGVLRDQGALG